MSDEVTTVDETTVAERCRLWLDDDGDETTEALRDAFAAFVPSAPGALIEVTADTEPQTWKRLAKLYVTQSFGEDLFGCVRFVCTGKWTAPVATRCFLEMRQFSTLRGLCMRGELCHGYLFHATT